MKVCPKQERPSARQRWPVIAAGLLGMAVLSLPGTAWLDQRPDRNTDSHSGFRQRVRPTPTGGTGIGETRPAAVAAGPVRSALPRGQDSQPGFRSSNEPFRPLVRNPEPQSGSTAPRRSRAVGPVFPNPPRQPPEQPEVEAQGALDELEVTYRLARATFGNRMGSTSGRPDLNPFQQALEGGGITSPDSGGGGDGGTTSAGESDSSGPPTGAESPPPPVDQPVPELPPDGGGVVDDPPLSFLITGATGQSSIGRASLSEDGAFVFEDDTEFHLFGGATFGFARPSLLLGERDQLVTADLNGDGRLDVVRTREQFLGTAVEVHFRSGNGFEFAAGGVFRFDSVSGLAVYDWDDDGSPELAVVTEARPNLHFYEIAGGELVYEREVTLRSKPAALIDSVSDSGERRLFLLSDDPRGVGSRYLTPRSGTVQLAWFPRGVQRFQLEGETAPEMTTLRQDNRLVLLRRDQGGALRLSGSLDVTVGVPLSVIGPHTSASRWELMYLP